MEILIALSFSPKDVIDNLLGGVTNMEGNRDIYRALDSTGAEGVREAAEYIVAQRPDLASGVREVLQAEFGIALSSSPESYVKIAADSIAKLRQSDVYRVLESAGKDAHSVARYIVKNRPDLEDEVREVMVEELGLKFP